MALIWGGIADAIFADTGTEHHEMYEHIRTVECKIRKFHPDFKIIIVKNERYSSLKDAIVEMKFFPSPSARYCTREFKIKPIDNYLRQFESEGVELMIGLNYDEIDKRTGNHGLLPFVNYSYPLAENGLNRNACMVILKKSGLYPNFPPYMQRGGCYMCFYKSKKEFEAMAILDDATFDKIIDLEDCIQDQRVEHYHVIPGIQNLREFKNQAKAILFKPEEMYGNIELQSPCGVFCNR